MGVSYHPSETIRVVQRGEDRTETVTKFVDLRFSKRFNAKSSNIEATMDLFNLLNANHVLGQTEALGATWGRPNASSRRASSASA